MDVIVNFRTAYMDDNRELVEDWDKIAYHYLTGWFAVDLIASLPIDLLVRLIASGTDFNPLDGGADELTLVAFVKTVRLLRLGRLAKLLESTVHFTIATMAGIARLLLFVLLLTHISACGFYGI